MCLSEKGLESLLKCYLTITGWVENKGKIEINKFEIYFVTKFEMFVIHEQSFVYSDNFHSQK